MGGPLLRGVLHTGDLIFGDRQARLPQGFSSPEPQQPCRQEELQGSGVIQAGETPLQASLMQVLF